MKLFCSFIGLIFPLTFIFLSCNTHDFNDTSKRNENWAWWVNPATGKGEWVPDGATTNIDSGYYTLFYSNGMMREKGKLKRGVKMDTIFIYDFYGKPAAYVYPDSTWYYYTDGPFRLHDAKGQLYEEGIVKNHKRGDKWKKYYENGSLLLNFDFKNDTGWMVYYYPTGLLKDSVYRNGEVDHFFVKRRHENGKLSWNVGVKDGKQDGIFTTYYENGQLQDSGRFINGSKEGKFIKRYPDGGLQQVLFFKNDIRHGPATTFHENGKSKTHIVFENGTMIGRVLQYNADGKIVIDTVLNVE